MDKKQTGKAFKGFTAVTVIIALLGLCNSAYIIFNGHEIAPIVTNVFSALALLGALLYIFRGGRKSEAMFYRGFLYFLALTELVSIIVGIGTLQNVVEGARLSFTVTLLTLAFGIYLFLATAKDLGKVPSFFCGGLAFLLFLGLLLSDVIRSTGAVTADKLSGGANLALSFVALYLIAAKYKDKTARGTK